MTSYQIMCVLLGINSIGFLVMTWAVGQLIKQRKELQKECEACWKKINADTQLKRKKEEAKKPREKNGRFARKC